MKNDTEEIKGKVHTSLLMMASDLTEYEYHQPWNLKLIVRKDLTSGNQYAKSSREYKE